MCYWPGGRCLGRSQALWSTQQFYWLWKPGFSLSFPYFDLTPFLPSTLHYLLKQTCKLAKSQPPLKGGALGRPLRKKESIWEFGFVDGKEKCGETLSCTLVFLGLRVGVYPVGQTTGRPKQWQTTKRQKRKERKGNESFKTLFCVPQRLLGPLLCLYTWLSYRGHGGVRDSLWDHFHFQAACYRLAFKDIPEVKCALSSCPNACSFSCEEQRWNSPTLPTGPSPLKCPG